MSFILPQRTPSREEHKLFQRLKYILTPSQPVGLVIFLRGLWILCYSVGVANQRQCLFFVSQWEQSSGDKNDKNAQNKTKKENLLNELFTTWQEYVHFGIHRRCNDYSRRFTCTFWDTLTLRSYSSDAVTELVLCCSVYWPNLLGWCKNVLKTLKTFMLLSWWCPLGQDKEHLLARQFIILDRLIPILTHLSCHWTGPVKIPCHLVQLCARLLTNKSLREIELPWSDLFTCSAKCNFQWHHFHRIPMVLWIFSAFVGY